MESVLAVSRGFSNLVIGAPKAFFGDFLAHLHDHFIPHHRNNYHPHIFSHRLTSLLAILLVSVKVFALSYISLGPAIPAFSSAITPENIISLTNEARKTFGLGTLQANSALDHAAQKKANDMAAKGYFAHNSPDGRVPWDFIKAAGYEYIMAGENLAVNFSQAESVEQAWMDSPTHKANILNKNFEEIGIGIAEGQYSGRTSVFVVQMFGVPAEQSIALMTEPTQVQTTAEPKPTAPAPAKSAPLAANPEIIQANTQIKDADLLVSVMAGSKAVKVLAIFGQRAAWLYPRADNSWQGLLPLQSLTQSGSKLSVRVFDIEGNIAESPVASFAPTAAENYNPLGQVAGKQVAVFGKTLDLQNFQDRFYLLFIAGILTCLVLAIAIRRHIQHLSVVANGSFVAILAVLLWMG